MRSELTISVRALTWVFIIAVLGLTVASIAGNVINYGMGYGKAFGFALGFVRLFDVDHELSIPTWYSSVAIMFCAGLLFVISAIKRRSKEPYFAHWMVLSFIFLFLSVDEAASMHERIIVKPLGMMLEGSVYRYFVWVAAGLAIVVIFLLPYVRFLLHLPRKTGVLFVISGAVYVLGAVGMEFVAGVYFAVTDKVYGTDNLFYDLLTTIEEFLEMSGIVIFIYTLMSYLRVYMTDEIRIVLKQ